MRRLCAARSDACASSVEAATVVFLFLKLWCCRAKEGAVVDRLEEGFED